MRSLCRMLWRMKLRVTLSMVLLSAISLPAALFRVATYNVENYLDQPTESRTHVKTPEAKAKIRESIRAANPDVIALEEMGTTNALLELRASLKADGLDFPYWEHVGAQDTNIHIAVLSRLPIIARIPHTNETFLLNGQRFHVGRGFAELKIQAGPNFTFTLIAGHLKSRRQSTKADQADIRFQDAKVLRGIVNRHLEPNPGDKLIVLGDFNDTKNSDSTREIIGRGKYRLTDTRPSERNGDHSPNENPRFEPRTITWTHYYGVEDSYSRIDYILLSPAMTRFWRSSGTFIPTVPDWGVGSDHRPIVAAFDTGS